MSNREIASLACKVLGVYFIIQGINVIANVLSVSFISFNQLENGISVGIIFPYTIILILGIFLWILSDKLSRMMVKEEMSKDYKGMKLSEIQRISFSVIGLLFVGNSLPKFFSSLTSMYIMREAPNMIQLLPGLVGATTQLVLGMWVFPGSQRLVNLLRKLKYAGIKREEDSLED